VGTAVAAAVRVGQPGSACLVLLGVLLLDEIFCEDRILLCPPDALLERPDLVEEIGPGQIEALVAGAAG
jgi:hypothetical protein